MASIQSKSCFIICKQGSSFDLLEKIQMIIDFLTKECPLKFSWTFYVHQSIFSQLNTANHPQESTEKQLATINHEHEYQQHPFTFKDWSDDHIPKSSFIDYIITLGGDGTILNSSFKFQFKIPPILSFNFGTLGFLTYFDFSSHKESLSSMIRGELSTLQRSRLVCNIYKNSHLVHTYHTLNEIVIERGSNPFMVILELFQNEHFLTSIHADGVIVATPTGSTAYSLSAGGCLVHPTVPCMLLTPICPHTLSFRPMVLPSSIKLTFSLARESRSTAWISCDSRSKVEVGMDDKIEIVQSPFPVTCFVNNKGSNYDNEKNNQNNLNDDWFSSLSRCLHWNVKKINSSSHY